MPPTTRPRLTPLTTATQTNLESRVRTQPRTGQQRYLDYWANTVVAFDVPDSHDQLTVTGSSTVETHPDERRPRAGWAALSDPHVQDRFAELLAPTALTELPDDLIGQFERRRAAPDPATAVAEAVRAVREGLRYERGGTDTMTTAAGAWAAGHGVCQDFVHLTLAILRHVGVPAGTSRVTCTPGRMRQLARRSTGRAMHGSRPGREAGGD